LWKDDPIAAPAVVDTPAAALLQFKYIVGAAYHALEGNGRVLSEERCKAVLMLKDLRGKVEAEKPWYRRQTNVFSIIMTIVQLVLKFAANTSKVTVHVYMTPDPY
jgi:hypothetical protein